MNLLLGYFPKACTELTSELRHVGGGCGEIQEFDSREQGPRLPISVESSTGQCVELGDDG